MEYLTRKERLAYLKTVPVGQPIHIEDLLFARFPPSCVYPAFWSSVNAGARLALDLDCRVVFSRKLLTVTLVPLDDEERGLQHVRLERLRKVERSKNATRMEYIRELQKQMHPQGIEVLDGEGTGRED